MPIQYSLHDNRLTADPGDRFARVLHGRALGPEELAGRIAATGSGTTRSSVTRADVLTVLDALGEAVEGALAEGLSVALPFAQFRARIQGSFESDEDRFDPDRHALLPDVRPGPQLRAFLAAGVELEKVAPNVPSPVVRHFTDLNTGEVDGALTPGGLGRLDGSRLQFETGEGGGVAFVAEADGAETPVEVFAQITPSRLQFLVPVLAAGAYRVEVRAPFGEDLRSDRFDPVLTVA